MCCVLVFSPELKEFNSSRKMKSMFITLLLITLLAFVTGQIKSDCTPRRVFFLRCDKDFTPGFTYRQQTNQCVKINTCIHTHITNNFYKDIAACEAKCKK